MQSVIKNIALQYADKHIKEYLDMFVNKYPHTIRTYNIDVIETKLRNQIWYWKYCSVEYNYKLLDAMDNIGQLLSRGELEKIFILTRHDLTNYLKDKAKRYGRKFH